MENKSALIAPVAITASSTLSVCGLGNEALYQGILRDKSPLKPLALFNVRLKTLVGEITHPLLSVRSELAEYDSRNSRVALTALEGELRVAIESAKTKYGAQRIGVVIGTSTSGLYETETAYAELLATDKMPNGFDFVKQHAYQATARFLQLELGLSGICFAISTACSSGAKAIAAGQRLIDNDLCDAVLVGGVDTLCRLTLRGFSSLNLVSENQCTPMDKNRQGINIGEAAGLLLLERSHANNAGAIKVLAVGESSDAYHMSTPHPEGEGAALAMRNALDLAGLHVGDIDYLNLHATATRINDQVESRAVYRVFSDSLPCSATKGITGHTLGAAGALETIIATLALKEQFIPGTVGLSEQDEECQCQLIQSSISDKPLKRAMSNSFGFGGNNASVIVSV